MKDVTLILQRIQEGHAKTGDDLFPAVYDELRRLAAGKMSMERADHTLSATALVNEAYIRLVDTDNVRHWDSRGHFFSAAAEAMRRVLVDHARQKKSLKRGGEMKQQAAIPNLTTLPSDPDLILDLNDAVDRLEEADAEAAELLKLLLFAGLSVAEASRMLNLPLRAAYRDWEYIRSWFAVHFEPTNSEDG
jgi:RNA polymerase sigma factor (TIGR02999 family)